MNENKTKLRCKWRNGNVENINVVGIGTISKSLYIAFVSDSLDHWGFEVVSYGDGDDVV